MGISFGEESLDRYLSDRALMNHTADIARCYVSVDSDSKKILGYYTLSVVSVAHTGVSSRVRRNAPSPIPAILLGRLAVDASAQGFGLGRHLVRNAILSTLAAAEHIGARVLLMHALKPETVSFYQGLGFKQSPTDELHLYLLLADLKKTLDT